MSNRASSRPKLTLLAFQDIIMSVSGILIVVVLLLALDLSREITPAAAMSEQSLTQLQEAINELAANEQTLAGELASGASLADQAAQHTPGELEADVSRLDQQIQALSQERDRLTAELAEVNESERALQGEASASQPLQEEAARLQAAAESKKSERDGLKGDDRPVYTLPQGFGKQGWLVVIGRDEIGVAPLGRRAPPTTFRGSGTGIFGRTSAVRGFEAWKQSLPSGERYFLLMVQPGGNEPFETLCESLEAARESYGFDVASGSQRLLHPQWDAYQ